MKNRLLLALLCWLQLLSLGAWAQNLSVQETFEGLGTDQGYTANNFSLTTIEYFERRALNASGGAYTGTTQPLANQQGSFTWTGEGVRGTAQTNVRSAGAVVLNPIANSANYRNFVITVAMAAPRGGTFTGAGSNSAFPADRIRVQYSFNGGAWTTAAMLMGNNSNPNGPGNGADFQQLATLSDSTAAATSAMTGGGTILDQTYRDITATLPAAALGANLRVRVVLDIKLVEVAFDNIRVTGVLDNAPKPTLTGIEAAAASYTEGGSPVQLTNALLVGYSDNSATTLTGGTVTTGGFVSGQDVLNFTIQNGITGSYSAGTGVLTLSGTASQAAYQAALRSITYSNSNPTTATGGTRSFTFQVYNGATLSTTASRNLVVTAVLNAPAALNYTENFDADGEGTRYFGNSFVSTSTQSGFFRATTSPATFNGAAIGQGAFTGWSGGYWFGEGNDNANNPGAPTSTLQLAPVNASGRVNLKFTIALGAAGNWLGYINAANPGDSFELFYRLNGGTPVKFGAFYGVNGTAPARQDADLDRLTPAAGTQLSPALQDITFDLPAAAAVGNLDFLLVQQARVQAEIAFDNIRITGTTLPTVTTAAATSVTGTSAVLGGNVTADGGDPVTERGVVYSSTNTTPTTANTKAANGSGTGTFSATTSGLTAGTTYYVRAYATNSAGTSYGSVVSFTTLAATVASVTRLMPSPTATAQVSYRVTFSAAVTGVSVTNFSLTTTGAISGTAVASVSGSGTTYTVVVNTGTDDGTLRLNVANGTGLSPTLSNVPYTAGEVYTITKSFTNPQLTIQSTGSTGGDVTAFVDAVQVLSGGSSVANALQNGSFETHDPLANGNYGYNPTGASWAFNTRSGIAENGSAFGPAPAPSGVAVAFVQSQGGINGQLQQNLAVPTGSYQVSFQTSQRNCCSTGDQVLNAFINGVFVGTIQPLSTTAYTTFTSATFSVIGTTLTAIAPSPGGRGQRITITGISLANPSALTINGANALGSIVSNTGTSLVVRVPATAAAGTGVVSITTAAGTATASFTLMAAPGNALAFDGANDYVSTPHAAAFNVTTALTLEAWVNTSNPNEQYITTKGEDSWFLALNPDARGAGLAALYLFGPSNAGGWLYGTRNLADGRWHHIAGTYDGAVMRLYVDGVLENSRAATAAVTTGSDPVYVGYRPTYPANGWNGRLDEVRVWNVARTPAQLAAAANAPLVGTEPGLLAYFNFDQGTPATASTGANAGLTTVHDLVAGAAGTLTGFALSSGNTASNWVASYAMVVPVATASTARSATGFTANWTAPAVGTATGYLLDVSTSPTFASAIAGSPFPVAAPATSYVLTGLNSSSAYYYRVRALNSALPVPDQGAFSNVMGQATPLPVELSAFTATAEGNRAVRLAWATASEKNSAAFEVERSQDGRAFERIGTVAAAGSSTAPRAYALTDAQLPAGTGVLYYRLRQVDLDGAFGHSPVRAVARTGAAAGLALYPNPTHDDAATLTGVEPGAAVTVFDALGRLVASVTANAAGTAVLRLPAELPAGVYVVRAGPHAVRLTVE